MPPPYPESLVVLEFENLLFCQPPLLIDTLRSLGLFLIDFSFLFTLSSREHMQDVVG